MSKTSETGETLKEKAARWKAAAQPGTWPAMTLKEISASLPEARQLRRLAAQQGLAVEEGSEG